MAFIEYDESKARSGYSSNSAIIHNLRKFEKEGSFRSIKGLNTIRALLFLCLLSNFGLIYLNPFNFRILLLSLPFIVLFFLMFIKSLYEDIYFVAKCTLILFGITVFSVFPGLFLLLILQSSVNPLLSISPILIERSLTPPLIMLYCFIILALLAMISQLSGNYIAGRYGKAFAGFKIEYDENSKWLKKVFGSKDRLSKYYSWALTPISIQQYLAKILINLILPLIAFLLYLNFISLL